MEGKEKGVGWQEEALARDNGQVRGDVGHQVGQAG